MRWFLRSKIHGATITGASVDYTGSIALDPVLIEKAGLMVGEKVLVADIDNGARLETYVISGRLGSREVCMNGAAARLIDKGDRVIVMGFELSDTPIDATVVIVDEENNVVGLT